MTTAFSFRYSPLMQWGGDHVMTEYSTISAVSRALQVIEVLADSPAGAQVTEIAERVGIEFSIASRILTTLALEGVVRRDNSSGRYQLTFKLVATISRYIEEAGFPDICMPLLQGLADKTGELVQLAVLEGTELWYIAKAEGKHRIRMLSALGRPAPLHASTVGKAFLASLPEEQALALAGARGLAALGPKTITTLSKLQIDLRKTRSLGYAVVQDEYVEGGTAVGAVVRSERAGGAVVGAVSIAAPSFRVKPQALKEFGRDVIELASRVASVWPVDRSSLTRRST